MSTKDVRLELKLFGSILDCRVFLENDEVRFWTWNAQKHSYTKNLPDYPITHTLDVRMVAKGKNGASTTLKIQIADQSDEELTCVIDGGSDVKETSITINL